MRIGYTPEQEELRRELRAYFAKLMTPDRAEAPAGVRSWTSATAAVIPAVICSTSAAVLMYGGMV